MNEKDYLRVARAGRLENGLLWPVPITLAVETPPPRGRAALRSADGTALGTLDVHDVLRGGRRDARGR